jgi:hypothetical protein
LIRHEQFVKLSQLLLERDAVLLDIIERNQEHSLKALHVYAALNFAVLHLHQVHVLTLAGSRCWTKHASHFQTYAILAFAAEAP